ncbi:hypothetical protein EDB19DRAFT_1830430 [Suillus lakei]|nr:hypothetical protein EDB19DRAFT_1830430 [Suillus lakei]
MILLPACRAHHLMIALPPPTLIAKIIKTSGNGVKTILKKRRCPESLASARALRPLLETEIRCKSSLWSRSIITEDQSAKSEAMYEAYGKLISEMHNRKLESGENLYGDIQKEKENGDEMEMSNRDGIGGRGSGTWNMTNG